MTGTSKVEAYFSGVASDYQQASTGRVWGAVRRREAGKLLELLGDVHGKDVLELGCGAGFYTRLLLVQGARHVWAVDLSQKMLDGLPKDGVTPLLGDALTIDPGRKFDTLLSAGMLEFVSDPAAALRNAAACATGDARLVILFPTSNLLGRIYRRFHKSHGLAIGLFSRDGIRALARQSGWRVEECVQAGPYSATARLVREKR